MTTGAILVGGRSRRMGRPKHAIELSDGRTMLWHVAAALRGVCPRVVAIEAAGADRGAPLADVVFDERVVDRRPDAGPLAGIEALLASGIDDRYLVCPCDVPHVTAALLRRLDIRAAAAVTALRVRGEAAPRPLPALFTAAALPAVRRTLDEGRRAVREGMAAAGVHEVVITPADAAALHNVNAPGDLPDPP